MARWEIYDEVISPMPEDLQVEECLIGFRWTMIRSRCVRAAHSPFEATLGLAAINSVLNSPDSVEKHLGQPPAQQPNISAFS
jgi:uncharacterized protein